MVKDYSRKYSRAGGLRQKVAERKSSGSGAGGKLFRKLVGLLVGGALVCGLCGSLWFGYMIRQGLRNLGTANVALEKNREENRLLNLERNKLLSREKIEKKAGEEAGLYRPSGKQIIRP